MIGKKGMRIRRRKKLRTLNQYLWVLVKERDTPLVCGFVYAGTKEQAKQLFLCEFGIIFPGQRIRRVKLED